MNDMKHDPREFEAQNARQGRIILKTRKHRTLFAGALAALLVVLLLILF